jgi:hypothetical protein
MTGEKKMFTSYVKNKDSQDSVIFGDGNQGKCWGPSASEGPQKQDLTVFLEYNV